jgi:hypothetical protein
MDGYGFEYSVLVNDAEGKEFVCTLDDSVCTFDERNEFVCTLDSNREIPTRFEELSARERSSCRSSVSVIGA